MEHRRYATKNEPAYEKKTHPLDDVSNKPRRTGYDETSERRRDHSRQRPPTIIGICPIVEAGPFLTRIDHSVYDGYAVLLAPSSALALAFCPLSRLPLPLAWLAFCFVVRARRSTRLVVLPGVQFSLDHLSPCGGNCHTMNSFHGTSDLGYPSPTHPSEQAVCFFVLIQRFRSLSQIPSGRVRCQ